jgi:hypothetical protein
MYNNASDTSQHTLSGRPDTAAFRRSKGFHSSATSHSLALSLCPLLLLVLLYVCFGKRVHVRVDILLNVWLHHCRLSAQIVDGTTQRIVLLDEEIAKTVRVPYDTRTKCRIHTSMLQTVSIKALIRL